MKLILTFLDKAPGSVEREISSGRLRELSSGAVAGFVLIT